MHPGTQETTMPAKQSRGRIGIVPALLTATVCLALGCVGSLDDDPEDYRQGIGNPGMAGSSNAGKTPPLDACVRNIFTDKCVTCHSATRPAIASPSLAGGDVGARLLDQAAESQCGNMPLLINSRLPNNSVLLKRISGTECGPRMPDGSRPLSSTEQDCIENWVKKFGAN